MQLGKLILICYCSKIIAFAQRSLSFCLAYREEKIREEKKKKEKEKKEAFATNLLEIKIKRFKTLKNVNVYEYTKKYFKLIRANVNSV